MPRRRLALTTTGKTPEQNLAELLRLIAVPDSHIDPQISVNHAP